jgi:hypothetical protein
VSPASGSDEEAPDLAARIRVTSGSPTPEEVAAVTAVMVATLEQLAEEAFVQEDDAPSAWERSRRGLRRPLVRGEWRRFGR